MTVNCIVCGKKVKKNQKTLWPQIGLDVCLECLKKPASPDTTAETKFSDNQESQAR